MNSKLLISGLVLVVIGMVGAMAVNPFSPGSQSETKSEVLAEATIYKSPSCGCCGKYAFYLRREKYEVAIEDRRDMSAIKEQFDIPYELESCHTMEVGGYVVEGHIPVEAVQKLLNEKPDIKGIGMAGMPSGSPGMPGPKSAEFVIYTINSDGTQGDVYMTI